MKKDKTLPLWEQDIALVPSGKEDGEKKEMKVSKITHQELDSIYTKAVKGSYSVAKHANNYEGILEMCEREYLRRGTTIPDLESKKILPSRPHVNRYATVKCYLESLTPEELEDVVAAAQEKLAVVAQDF